ncbi:hypothetical protein RB614_15755 [Phytohabitans sp. ZYX-F-186]|uniref:Uncharacterized protein n=1 Tax=Phytohabitans maris TaxID=3071409 RepID=A0ABU0ZFY1_9ACTN|nr:hypothetical protein [Phytohabitans sp. ZYX-F-186]MDQ7905968.1 hypothetical protein [Phytohabitans sp. ZYX-F-186]
MAKTSKDDNGRVTMSATDRSGKTHTMTGDGTSGRTHTSRDGSVVQTDGDQVFRNDR